MEFESQRFIVRKLTLDDFEPFYHMQSNEHVMRHIKPPLNYEESKIELGKFIEYYTSASRYFKLWAIEDKNNQAFVGLCGVYENRSKENEIAYRLREQFWGKGIGKEIVKALIDHCFGNLQMGRIVAYADVENIGSLKILNQEMNFVEQNYAEDRGKNYRKYDLLSNQVPTPSH